MNKQQEALKLALEALEEISSHYMSLPKKGCMALAAIEEALAQPEQEPVAWIYTSQLAGNQTYITRYASDLTTYKADKVTPLYTSPPASKPWVSLTDEDIQEVRENCGTGYCSCIECPYEQPAQQYCKLCGDSFSNFNLEGAVCGDCAHGIEKPVLAEQPAQPSKPWVGLTRDERMSIINRLIGQDWVYALDAIEAKLKEKNNG